jgi:hypothetical protein
MDKRPRLPLYTRGRHDQEFGIAAPLLGGFSITLIGVLLQSPPSDSGIRWRDAGYLFFVGATLLYLLPYTMRFRHVQSVSLTIHFAKGWPDHSAFLQVRAAYRAAYIKEDDRAQLIFEIANLCLLAGLFATLCPPVALLKMTDFRLAVLAGLGTVVALQALLISRRWIRISWLPRPLQALLVPHIHLIEYLRKHRLDSLHTDQIGEDVDVAWSQNG